MSNAMTLLQGVTEDHSSDNQNAAPQTAGAQAFPREGGARCCSLWLSVDRVLATVLFTDIVGSTEKAAALGDRGWRHLLEAHDAIVRRNLACFRGREVKTTGDGFLATFDIPARGVRCACAIVDEIKLLGIEIRAGLHTGECEMIGDDVNGIAVHTGARVAALAGSGEILVSGTVKDLVAGSGLRFSDRGIQSLKGIPGEWRIFAAQREERDAGLLLEVTRAGADLPAAPESLRKEARLRPDPGA
jgi:class 3 adenylate cyclase